jgi:hypothetical protein
MESETHPAASLFDPEPEGTSLERVLAQWRQIATGSREGGFFLMIGRKPAQGDEATRA